MAERESFDTGTWRSTVSFPSEPPESDLLLFRRQAENGSFAISYCRDGRIRAEVHQIRDDVESPALSAESCPVYNPANVPCVLGMSWSVPENQIHIVVDMELVASTTPDAARQTPYTLPVQNGPIRARDFSRENALAKMTRRDRLAGIQPRPGYAQASPGEVRSAVEVEAQQIHDLLGWVRGGATHHALGLGSRLRLLIADRSRHLPLLQRCAAQTDQDLVVFTATDPYFVPAFMESEPLSLLLNISPHQVQILPNPVDLDVWLELPGGDMGGKRYTHQEILSRIGNTVASHFDADLDPYVFVLKGMSTGILTATEHDAMVGYLCRVAEAVLPLCRQVISV